MDPYLAQWFIHDGGGREPVPLARGSVESKILEEFLTLTPYNASPDMPGKGKVAVIIPTFRYKPAEYYHYLPSAARSVLINVIRDRFDVALWKSLHIFDNVGERQDELIYAWMEYHGIDMTEANWNAIAKRYQRQRKLYRDRQLKKEEYNSKK